MSTADGPWERVRGEPAAVASLRAALVADEVAHAWLLVGPRGVGQRELTQILAMALNCPTPIAPDVACGVCSTCDRILRGVHPSVEEFEPEGAFHVVDAVRHTWIPTASRSLTEGRRRVLRVVAADRMNVSAQNAFLKLLEEPPPSVVWVLEAEKEDALLDTVVSRCRRLDLVPWTPEVLQAYGGQLEPAVPAGQRVALARAALGSPERMRDLADPVIALQRDVNLGIVDRLATGGPGLVVPVAKELNTWAKGRVEPLKAKHKAEFKDLEEAFGVDGPRGGWPPKVRSRLTKRFERLERQEHRRALDLLLDDLASYLRDLLALQAGGDPAQLVNIDHEPALRRDALRLPPVDAIAGLTAIARCRDALDRNGNPELQLERVLLALALSLYRAAA